MTTTEARPIPKDVLRRFLDCGSWNRTTGLRTYVRLLTDAHAGTMFTSIREDIKNIERCYIPHLDELLVLDGVPQPEIVKTLVTLRPRGFNFRNYQYLCDAGRTDLITDFDCDFRGTILEHWQLPFVTPAMILRTTESYYCSKRIGRVETYCFDNFSSAVAYCLSETHSEAIAALSDKPSKSQAAE
jgi:hypothetical protein